jgi:dolichol-phosphate mannosyltransferase
MARAISRQSMNGPLRALRFGAVGLTGIGINQGIFVLLTQLLGIHYLFAAVLATQGSTTWNFILVDRWAMSGRSRGRAIQRFVTYAAVNNATLVLRLPALWLLSGVMGLEDPLSNFITLILLFVVRFGIADRLIWAGAATPESLAPESLALAGEEPVGRPAVPVMVEAAKAPRFQYDVAGILALHSAVELPELAYFRTDVTRNPDLVITIGSVGGKPSRGIRFVPNESHLSYTEHLGRLGASFNIKLGSPTEILVSPLLARSRHVLYTNVVEALLRFMLVDRGYVLLHSGCVAKDGVATLLSAQTDTGKTSTVIRLVRDYGYSFLSDDMTIVSPNGIAISYPKPMTLSFHTMATIAGAKLGAMHRAKLSVQSRVHSKSGRSIGQSLGTRNIPIMAINSATQIAVPPPKYHITSLLDTAIMPQAVIGQVVFIERGGDSRERMPLKPAIDLLIENTDDAYGFPPFATLAPHLRVGGAAYPELRERERALLAQSIAGSNIWRLRVAGHGWAELIPTLGQAGDAVDEPAPLAGIPVAAFEQAEQDQIEFARGLN